MTRSIFRFALVAILAIPAAACTTVAPDAGGVQAITQACLVDATVRPQLDVLLAVPGLATPAERVTVADARLVIDPVCANPSGTFAANTATAFAGATGQIAALVEQLAARKTKVPVPAPVASAVKVSVARIPYIVSV